MILIVGRDQGEGDREIAQRIGSQQQDSVAQVQFVDAQSAREVRQRPLAVGGQIGLADLPVEAVVEEAVGQVEEEVALQGVLQPVEAHAVVEQAVDDGVANAVGVLGPRFDAWNLGTEGLAAGATGAVFSDGQFDEDDLAEGDVADAAGVGVLASAPLAAMRTRVGLGGTPSSENANARRVGIHACVLFGLVW